MISGIPAGDGKTGNLFYSVYIHTSHPLQGNVSVVCHAESLLLQASHEAMLNKITKKSPFCTVKKFYKNFEKKNSKKELK